MGNGEWEMAQCELGMGNGERGLGIGEWEIEFFLKVALMLFHFSAYSILPFGVTCLTICDTFTRPIVLKITVFGYFTIKAFS